MTTEDDEEGEDNEASSLGSGRRALAHLKTEAVEAADRDVRQIVSRKGSAKNSDRSRKSRRSSRRSILENSAPAKVGAAEKAGLTTTAL